MPLNGNIETDAGAVASFHVVGQLLARPIKDEVIIRLDSYLDQTAYESGKDPLRQKRWTIGDQSYDTYFKKAMLTQKGAEPIGQAEQYLVDKKSNFTIK